MTTDELIKIKNNLAYFGHKFRDEKYPGEYVGFILWDYVIGIGLDRDLKSKLNIDLQFVLDSNDLDFRFEFPFKEKFYSALNKLNQEVRESNKILIVDNDKIVITYE